MKVTDLTNDISQRHNNLLSKQLNMLLDKLIKYAEQKLIHISAKNEKYDKDWNTLGFNADYCFSFVIDSGKFQSTLTEYISLLTYNAKTNKHIESIVNRINYITDVLGGKIINESN